MEGPYIYALPFTLSPKREAGLTRFLFVRPRFLDQASHRHGHHHLRSRLSTRPWTVPGIREFALRSWICIWSDFWRSCRGSVWLEVRSSRLFSFLRSLLLDLIFSLLLLQDGLLECRSYLSSYPLLSSYGRCMFRRRSTLKLPGSFSRGLTG